MKNIKRITALALCTIFIVMPFPAKIRQNSVFASELETMSSKNGYELVKEKAKQRSEMLTSVYGATGAQYALIDNGKIEVSGVSGVYSKSENTAITNEHMFGIGSISKMFTTAAVMQLVDEGKINLDTPVYKYVPEFFMKDGRYPGITVRMLLNHSSGLMGSSFSNTMLLNDNDTKSHDEFLKTLRSQRLKADPGTYSVYCNDGFTLAEILVEKVSGENFTQYIKNHISSKLNLDKTKTPQDSFDQKQLVKTYLPNQNTALPPETLNAIGAGGIYSTAEDLCRFAQTFMQDSTEILSKESITAAKQPEYKKGFWPKEGESILGYGLGFDSVDCFPFSQYGIQALTKGGDTMLYHGSMIILPDYNMAAVVLTSGGTSTYNQVAAQEMLLDALEEKELITKKETQIPFNLNEKETMPENLSKYSGIYLLSTGGYQTKIEDDRLYLSVPGAGVPAITCNYTKDGYFVTEDGSLGLKFVEETNGQTYIFVKQYFNFPGLGSSITSQYLAQKSLDNQLTEEITQTWKQREGKKYFVVNEKYSSVFFVLNQIIAEINYLKELPGYIGSDKIITNNLAQADIAVPGTGSRDFMDYKFYQKNGIEYLEASGTIYMAEEGLINLPSKKTTVQIKADGHSIWYKIPESVSDKTVTITSGKKAAFVTVDKNGMILSNSYLDKKDTVVLPKDGYLVLSGDAGTKFAIRYNK